MKANGNVIWYILQEIKIKMRISYFRNMILIKLIIDFYYKPKKPKRYSNLSYTYYLFEIKKLFTFIFNFL